MKKNKQLECLKDDLFTTTFLTENNLFAVKGGGSCPSKLSWTYWIVPDGMDSRLGR